VEAVSASAARRKALGIRERSIMVYLKGEALMPTGIVRSFNVKSGFGFIRPDDGSKDLFVHSGAVKRAGLKPLQENQKISYDVRSELDGRRSAVDLKTV
jgi:CspA family cold shock protein